ncbi:MAG: glycosyltransferase family 39 protein [Planctomycetota bacterium]
MTTTTASTPLPSAATPNTAGAARWVTPAGLALLIVAAAVLRLTNLGALAYQVDEGYQLSGVTAILEHGVPRLESGHAYTRAPLFLYTEAAFAEALGLSPFSMRLPAALVGVLCVPIAFLFGRRLVGPAVGWALAAMIALSHWHVELSRYARFYTLLMALVMLATLAFYAGYVERKTWGKVGYWACALVAVTVHDAAVVIGLLFLVLLPAPNRTLLNRGGLVVQAGLVGGAWMAYRKLESAWSKSLSDPDRVLVYKASTEGELTVAEASARPAWLPDIKLPSPANTAEAWDAGAWAMLVPGGLALSGCVVLGVWAARRREGWAGALAGLVVVAALFHQGSIAVLLGALGLACFVRARRDLVGPLGVGLLTAGLVLLVHAAVNVKVLHYGRVQGLIWLFRYPDWERYALTWLWWGWPVVLTVLPIGLVMLLWRGRREDGGPGGGWLLVGLLLAGLCLGGLVDGKFNESRYFFHLWPVILSAYALVFVGAGAWLADRLKLGRGGRAGAIAGLVALGIGLSSDLRPTSAWAVTQRDYTTDRDPVRGVLNMPGFAGFHEDVESVNRAIAEGRGPGDRVICVGPPHRATLVMHYAGRVDYVVSPAEVFVQKLVDEAGRWRDPVTGAEIVHTPARLAEVLGALSSAGTRLWVSGNDRLVGGVVEYVDPRMWAMLESVTPADATRGRDGSSYAALAELGRFADDGVGATP